MLIPLGSVNIMSFSAIHAFLKCPPPPADLQDEADFDHSPALTDKEIAFLEFFESMSEENQAALTRVAQYLDAHPQAEPVTKEKLKELFLSA